MNYYEPYIYTIFMVVGIGFIAFAMCVFGYQAMESAGESRVVDGDCGGELSDRDICIPDRVSWADDFRRVA